MTTPASTPSVPYAAGRWSDEQIDAWYGKQPWLVGANFIPSDAANQLTMWQAETFNPDLIDKELGWAAGLGMNTMRVFLHDLLWQQDAEGFLRRIDQYLAISTKHGISTMLVLFDSVWRPEPKLGVQPEPVPGVHNSQWVQNPGYALADPTQEPRLEAYVKGVVGRFANDPRVVVWDIWNEPSNLNAGRFTELPNKQELVKALLPKAFAWARSAKPTQPLTAGVWIGDKFLDDPLAETQLALSDIISFHSYDAPDKFLSRVAEFAAGRPLLCTEYMARKQASTFEAILPLAKERKVGMYNWGFVAGKSQTFMPWDSWQNPYITAEPDPWFHDIFREDGQAYREDEVAFLRKVLSKA
ncbi:cellulase family glycosylhydrolase [Devosia sp.]|uniref:cellulase family glycosylhydrolase n=1 Tax=Devosia sp. TaxID=1871048 RepID=UPI0032653B8F